MGIGNFGGDTLKRLLNEYIEYIFVLTKSELT